MDQSRRQALMTLGIVTTAVAGGTSLQAADSANTDHARPPATRADQFSVQVEHAWAQSDITLIIKNISATPATINELQPCCIVSDPGVFSLEDLTANGPVTIQPGSEIRVPFVTTDDQAANLGHFDRSLQEAIQRNLHISTNNSASAEITTIFNPRIV
jgi:hypothetical protein